MSNKNLVLTAMIFSVAMMFIDQTIVALAIPSLNHDLQLSPTGASGSSTAICCRSRLCSRSAAASPTSSAIARR